MADGFGSFLSGLLDSLKMGAQSTADAYQQDLQSMQEGKLPQQAISAGGQVLQSMGNPSINPTIPAMRNVTMIFDPDKGWQEAASKVYPGGNWLEMFTRQGGLGNFLEALLKLSEQPRP